MKTSARSGRIAQRGLRWTPYLACLGGIAAAVVGLWVPFYPGILGLAAATGPAGFFLEWWKLRRRRKSLVFDGALLGAIASAIGINSLPSGVGYTILVLGGMQFFGVWLFTFCGLASIFRGRFGRDLEVYAS